MQAAGHLFAPRETAGVAQGEHERQRRHRTYTRLGHQQAGLRVRFRGLLQCAIQLANLPIHQAAAYGWALLRNHPFVDGNKRIALAAMVVFLDLNGWELTCSEAEETAMVLRAAAGEISERACNDWLRLCTRKKG